MAQGSPGSRISTEVEDRIVSVALPPDGSIGEEQTLATAVSNGIDGQSTFFRPPQVAAATAGGSAALWGERTVDGPPIREEQTFGAARFDGDTVEPIIQPVGRAVDPVLSVDADRQIVAAWRGPKDDLMIGDVGAGGSLENVRTVAATGFGFFRIVGVVATGTHSYLVWERSLRGTVKSVIAARIDTAAPGPAVRLLRRSPVHAYSQVTVSGDRVYAFERGGRTSSLISVDPRMGRGVQRLATVPRHSAPIELAVASRPGHSGAALAWGTWSREIYAARAGRRHASIRLLTPGRADGRGPDVALSSRGRATVVWRDGVNGRTDRILAAQMRGSRRVGRTVNVSGGSRGIAPQVVVGAGDAPEVMWNEKGGELKLARAPRP